MEEEIDYTFDEDLYLAEMKSYIEGTYRAHYSGRYQATDMIIDAGHGAGFCIGSIMKYAKRYGKKDGYNRKDILKIIHYGIILLHVHDTEINPVEEGPKADPRFPPTGVSYTERFFDAKGQVTEVRPHLTKTNPIPDFL